MSQSKILSVVVSTRGIFNAETGIDLFVYEQPSVQSKRTIRSKYYSLTVVSSLPCLKAFAETKSADVIQYTMQKNYEEFAQLHRDLCDKFLAARIPNMPNKPISVIDTAATAKERQKAIDKFVKYCASNKKIAGSKELLEFLGVRNEYIGEEKNEKGSDKEEKQDTSEEEVDLIPDKNAPPEALKKKVELFKPAVKATELFFAEHEEADDDLNLTKIKIPRSNVQSTSLFGDNDIDGGGVKIAERDLVILCRATSATKDSAPNEHEEIDISDIEDDEIEKLVRRLGKSRETRETHRKQAGDTKIEVKQTNVKQDRSNSVKDIENFNADDISKYIQENSVSLDSTDLGFE